jgi:transcriptional regulator with XRE-family HTH domain
MRHPTDPILRRAVGKAIRALRARAGISQEGLALEAEVGRSYMGRLERGEYSPSTETIYKLLPHLKVSFSQFAKEVERQLSQKPMSKPRIVQCLCGPERHALIALPYEPGVTLHEAGDIVLTEANAASCLRIAVDVAIQARVLNPWCEICRAPRRQWIFEDAALAFKSLEEALPHLKACAEAQQETRRMLRDGRN